MSNDVLVVAEHADGKLTDTTFELVGAARTLAAGWGGQVVAVLIGNEALAAELGGADLVVTVDAAGLSDYTAEAYEKVLAAQIGDRSPRLVLMATTTQGLDLAAALSALCACPLVSYVVGLDTDGDAVVATAQIYGGKIMAEVAVEAQPAICGVIAGSFPADAGRSGGSPTVEAAAGPDLSDLRTRFAALNAPEAGDVDITAADVLVAVGRGIGSEDDLELVQEFADAIDAPVAASRPVTDAGWLPKSRQVGKSGQKVKPRAYLMFGISGAPEHLEGMRDAELIIACNTDEHAPIFDVAHYGTTADLFDLLPELTERVEG
jgi:electron transfer flavoprotein alpha subunit